MLYNLGDPSSGLAPEGLRSPCLLEKVIRGHFRPYLPPWAVPLGGLWLCVFFCRSLSLRAFEFQQHQHSDPCIGLWRKSVPCQDHMFWKRLGSKNCSPEGVLIRILWPDPQKHAGSGDQAWLRLLFPWLGGDHFGPVLCRVSQGRSSKPRCEWAG